MTVEWRQRRLRDANVVVEVSADGGANWREVASAAAVDRAVTFVPDGEVGEVLSVRVRVADGDRASNVGSARITSPVVSVDVGTYWSAALHADGRIRCWGGVPPHIVDSTPYPEGHLFYDGGKSYMWNQVYGPRLAKNVTDVKAFAVGDTFLAYVTNDGGAWIVSELLGGAADIAGNRFIYQVPHRFDGVPVADWVRAGQDIAFFHIPDGRYFVLGGPGDGAFGERTSYIPGDQPYEYVPFRGAVDVQLGGFHALALRPDGRVLSVGANLFGALGYDRRPADRRPMVVPGLFDVVAIAARDTCSMALLADGTVYAWGGAAPGGSASYPVKVQGADSIVAISVTHLGGRMIRSDGTLLQFGEGAIIGDGDHVAEVAVEWPIAKVRSVSSYKETHVITVDGRRYSWMTDHAAPKPKRPQPIDVPVRVYSE